MREDFLKGLQSAGVKTFGKLAYICAGGPKAGDDGPLLAAVKTLTGNEPAGADLIDLRRLWAEAQALSLLNLRTRVERTHSDVLKEMPLAERLVRVERQKSLLRGLVYNEYVEPAHSLVDRVMHVIEVGCIHYLAPEKCPSRHDEINVTRPEQQLTFDGQGMVKIAKRELDLRCDISGELRLRDALRRKALAFDVAGLASFERLEEWRTQMFQAMTRQPPAGYKYDSAGNGRRSTVVGAGFAGVQRAAHHRGGQSPASGQAHRSLGKILRSRLLHAAPPSRLGRRIGSEEAADQRGSSRSSKEAQER